MSVEKEVQRAEWLTEAISGLEQLIDSEEMTAKGTFKRILREYQDELKALKGGRCYESGNNR